MSQDEKLMRHKQLYKYVTSRTVQFWARSFVKELRSSVTFPDQSNPTPLLDFNVITERYLAANKRLLLFDYDVRVSPVVGSQQFPNVSLICRAL
jgi:trehalose 6-phosphate synthase/phosphatase